MCKNILLSVLIIVIGLGIFMLLNLKIKEFFNYSNPDTNIMYQGFCWFNNAGLQGTLYSYLNGKIDQLKKYQIVWLPCPCDSGGMNQMGYTPEQWFNLNNSFGSSDQQKKLLIDLNNNNINPIADVIINHRNGTGNWSTFTNPSIGNILESIVRQDDLWIKGPNGCKYFGDKNIKDVDLDGYISYCSQNPQDECCINIGTDKNKILNLKRWDDSCDYNPIEGCLGFFARELAHDNPDVQNFVIKYLKFLQQNGYTGFRFDFTRGYLGKVLRKYLNNVGNPFSVGEFWVTDPNLIENWINNSGSSAFDFPLKFILNNVFNENNFSYLTTVDGKMPSITGINPKMSVTFLDNHDTYRTDDKFPEGKELLGYIYLLTHSGTPCVFFLHDDSISANFCCNTSNCENYNCSKGSYYYIQQQLNDLISLRHKIGIISTSNVCIDYAGNDMYCAYITGKYGQLAIKLGGGLGWDPSSPKNPSYNCNKSSKWYQHPTLCGTQSNVGYCIWTTT